jgi:hypothetical protein
VYDPPEPPLAAPAAVPGVPAAAVPGVVAAGVVAPGVVTAGVGAADVAAGAAGLDALPEGRRLPVDVGCRRTSSCAGAVEATVACPAGWVGAATGDSTGAEVPGGGVTEVADAIWPAAADTVPVVVADGAAEVEPRGFRCPGPEAAITPTRVEAAKTRAARRCLEKHERKREGPLVVRHVEQRSVFTK